MGDVGPAGDPVSSVLTGDDLTLQAGVAAGDSARVCTSVRCADRPMNAGRSGWSCRRAVAWTSAGTFAVRSR